MTSVKVATPWNDESRLSQAAPQSLVPKAPKAAAEFLTRTTSPKKIGTDLSATAEFLAACANVDHRMAA